MQRTCRVKKKANFGTSYCYIDIVNIACSITISNGACSIKKKIYIYIYTHIGITKPYSP